MVLIGTEEPLAVAAVEAIHTGDADGLRRLLGENPELATAALGTTGDDGMTRTLLHVATDWPGHFPNVAATVGVLVEAGADVNGRFSGPHTETPLHWAASSDDVEALDALLDAGADIEAPACRMDPPATIAAAGRTGVDGARDDAHHIGSTRSGLCQDVVPGLVTAKRCQGRATPFSS